MSLPWIRRGFVDVGEAQMHYRTAGTGSPLLMIHASPGSSRQMRGLIADFADGFRVIAPDTPGNGDTPALPIETPQITDLARAYLGLLDALGLGRIPVYGTHTGAAIATELAILAPERVERVILDGVQQLTDAAREELLARYAHPFPPDLDGAYLARVFQFCRDQFLFYPWYERTLAGQRPGGLPGPRTLRDLVMAVLEAGETYHLNYRAAFRWRVEERLPLVSCPTLLIAAENDPLIGDTRGAASMAKAGRYVDLPRYDAADYAARRKTAIGAFLAQA